MPVTPDQAPERYLAKQFRDTWPGNQETPGQVTPGWATDLLCKAVGLGKKVSQLVAYAGFDHMMHKLIMLFLMLYLWFSHLLPWNPLCFEFDEFLST